MKKIHCLVVFVFLNSGLSYGQFDVSIGGSMYNSDVSMVGINFGMSYDHFYFDLSSNMAVGKGEELDFSSSYSYSTDKAWIGLMNIGYNIYINNKWFITPIIGYGQSKYIYQDPIGWDTYYYGDANHHFNIGISTKFFIDDNIGLMIGGGSFERFKAALCYRF
jgi:hypothetical protein